jgi:hypothetical protein
MIGKPWAIRGSRVLIASVLACAVAGPPVRGQAPDTVVERAMRDELARSMQLLQVGGHDRPYFISYTVQEYETVGISATGGSLLWRRRNRARTFAVTVRVGDRTLDNSNFLDFARLSLGGDAEELGRGSELPTDDDYLELRRQMWLATDGAYKRAVESLAAKRAALTNRSRPDTLPDFDVSSITHTIEGGPVAPVVVSDLEALVRDISSADSGANIYDSRTRLDVVTTRTHYLNSEGTSYTWTRPVVVLKATARTQADGGMPLSDAVEFYAHSADALPSRERIVAQVRAMCVRLDSLRHAVVADQYNGPVLFEGRAAAELFSERFAPAVVGHRTVMMARPEMEAAFARMGGGGAGSLADKLGGRVLPVFLSVVDDPTMAAYGQEPLFGTYKADDDGVAARATRVVDNGVLKTFLTTRVPVAGVAGSTGNHRGVGPAPSNVRVEVQGGLTEAELKAQLLLAVKQRQLPYGLIVRELGPQGGTPQSEAMAMVSEMSGQGGEPRRSLLAVYRLYPDGREQLVRGAYLSGFTVQSFKDIVAASKDPTTYHSAAAIQAAMGGAFGIFTGVGISGGSMQPLSSYIVPSFLLDDATISKPGNESPTLPFTPPPSATE